MSTNKDFTRWNRAGLDQFQYVDGNAATFLEFMRQSLIDQFTDEAGELKWADLNERVPGLSETITSDTADRLISQYNAETGDYAWEIVRVLCRSAHILSEYLNAYSNETFIETANEWETIRKLVNMLDCQPSPPASATTTLCIVAKEGGKGLLTAGFQVKNSPDDGSSPTVFETFGDVELDSTLNRIRPADWNKSQAMLIDAAVPEGELISYPLENEIEDLTVGSFSVLLDDANAYVASVELSGSDHINLRMHNEITDGIKKSEASLFVNPKSIQAPMLNGPDVVYLDSDVISFSIKSSIAWKKDAKWYIGCVEKIDKNRLLINAENNDALPESGTDLYLLSISYPQTLMFQEKPKSLIILPKSSDLTAVVWDEEGNELTPQTYEENKIEVYQFVPAASMTKLFYLPKDAAAFGTTISKPANDTYEFSGNLGKFNSQDWVIACSDSGKHALQVKTVDEKPGSCILKVFSPIGDAIHTVFSDFDLTVYPGGYDENRETVIDIAGESASGSTVFLDSIPDSLKKGQTLIINNAVNTVVVKVAAVSSGTNSMIITPSIADLKKNDEAVTFLKYNTVFSGNCVKAGHGEIQNQMIAGSGDASKLNQRFTLEPVDISFIPDATMSSGMRAALSVEVSGRVYQNVQCFSGSKPADPHYLVRITETGKLKLVFGDGKNAKRLPTGRNNIKVTYRSGSGTRGNLTKSTLTKIVNSNALVESVSNPVDCAGGNECEAVDSLRENASSSILTLGKAVSVSDFEKLAVTHSSIWKASAFEKPSGFSRNRNVCVIIVPSEGKIQSGLNSEIETYLTETALPGVIVNVENFRSLFLGLKVMARINKEEYDQDQVETDIKDALMRVFSLSSGKLGGNIYRSQIYQVVDSVTGVMNSTCFIDNAYLAAQLTGDPVKNKSVNIIIGSDGIIKTVMPAKDQVIYINDKAPELDITVNSYLATESVI